MRLKHGAFSAGVLFVLLLFYFLFFIFTSTAVENLENSLNNSPNTTMPGGIYSLEQCTDPRFKINPLTLETEEMKDSEMDIIECSYTEGVKTKANCLNISGCEWENETEGWEIIGICFSPGGCTEYETCKGTLNYTYYDLDVVDFPGGVAYIKPYNGTTFFNSFLGFTSVCTHPNVITEYELCNNLGCTWGSSLDIGASNEGKAGMKTFWSLTLEILTFTYYIDVNNSFINIILNILFYYLPLIALYMSLYFMIPFLHGG